jgi:TonB-linked SusC/RagA family outer membrane protein
MRKLRCANLFPNRGKQAHIGKIIRLASLLLILSLTLHAKIRSQQLVSLSFKNGSLETVLKEIRRQTGYLYGLQDQWKEKAKLIDISVTNIPLNEALNLVFKSQPFTYVIIGKTIVVTEKATLVSTDGFGPKAGIKVQGTVFNENGERLSGANVTIKETEKGTITNAKGEFEISSVPANSTLIISFIGYATQQINVKDGTNVKIYLKVANNELDKVVVQAYGTTTRRLATGNIGTVTAEQIARQPVVNVLDALQGQVAGVVVTNTSGYASGSIKVEIRGRNTINPGFSSDPLYIIDGVPLTILDITSQSAYSTGSQGVIQSGLASPASGQSPFFSVDPADIESIEVLKDADATAIYGSRGSNGVILITTKKGKAGKTKFGVNVYNGISETPRYYHMLNTQQYVSMRKEALANDGLPIDINNAPDLVLWDTTRYTDWQKYMWGGLGRRTNAHADLSGGDARTTFRIGAEYLHQTEILTYNGANQRATIDFNINHKSLNQRFNVGFTSFYSIVTSDQIGVPSAITLPPNAPAVFDSKGNLNYNGWAPLNGLFPFFGYLQPYSTKTYLLNSNLILSYDIAKGFVFRTNFGYNNIQTTQNLLNTIASQDPSLNPLGSSSSGLTFIHNTIIEPQAEYNSFIGKGKLGVLAGATTQNNATTSDYLFGGGYNSDALISSFSVAPTQFISNLGAQYKYDALFSRVNYNWENKYLVNFNVRRDGSSKFGPGRQFGNFWSIGGAWIFSEENWIKQNIPFLSFGKIRGSYGTVGGDQVGNYSYLSQWLAGRGTYNGSIPFTPIGHTDSLLQWQVNRKTEIALNLGFIKDRINIEVSLYRNQCNNQLVNFPTPAFSGFTSVTANSPANVENEGLEIVINSKIVDDKKFKVSASFNIGINRNRLLAYPNLSLSPYAGIYFIGKSLGVRRFLHYTGIDPQTGEYTFADKNHDGQITYDFSGRTSDDSYLYDLTPKFDGGFTTNLSYKNLELSVFFYFKKQLGSNAYTSLDAPGDETNQPVSVLNRWQKPGDITNTPRFTTSPPPSFANYASYSNAPITDASFIRLQNLSLTYSLPGHLIKKIGAGSLKVFAQAKNLFYITKYIGLDPEVQSLNSPPLPRTIVTGISFEF